MGMAITDYKQEQKPLLDVIARHLAFQSRFTGVASSTQVSDKACKQAIGQLLSFSPEQIESLSIQRLLSVDRRGQEEAPNRAEIFKLSLCRVNTQAMEIFYFILLGSECLPIKNVDNLALNLPAAISLVDELLPATTELESDEVAKREYFTSISISASQLKQIIVNDLVSAIIDFNGFPEGTQSNISLVIRELFSNALEHGLLQLDSQDKCSIDGFSRYYERRLQALKQLATGMLCIEITYDLNEHFCLVEMTHNGQGFDSKPILSRLRDNNQPNEHCFHGRGLMLISMQAKDLWYEDSGRKACVLLKV